jgi:transposase InsO family protein|tara:strand:- start:3549 stop:4073 length:525 start_codon:yes stop_codon:yes gene_type:complete
VHQILHREGTSAGRKRVKSLMREASRTERACRVYCRTPSIGRFYESDRHIRLNQLVPAGLNQQWGAGLTYIQVGNEWRYLAVVLDVYSRKIIGWSLGSRKTADLTLQALRYALRVRTLNPRLIFYTDRGVEYGAHMIQSELDRHGIRPNMNRPNQCTDNAHMQSFFHSLKAKFI